VYDILRYRSLAISKVGRCKLEPVSEAPCYSSLNYDVIKLLSSCAFHLNLWGGARWDLCSERLVAELEAECDELRSSFACNFKLRRYTKDALELLIMRIDKPINR